MPNGDTSSEMVATAEYRDNDNVVEESNHHHSSIIPTTSAPMVARRRHSYESLAVFAEEEDGHDPIIDPSSSVQARRTLWNFIGMSVLFSANHGCVVACLSLATPRLGSTGAWQSGILYLTYTASALLGATYIVKRLGPRNAMWLGMGLYCIYVGCFWVATTYDTVEEQRGAAWTGAAIGGIGAGFLWTAQGAYFGMAAEEHAKWAQQPVSTSTASLGGIFAFIYLAEEVLLRLLSSVLVSVMSWKAIFAVYTVVTVTSTFAMTLVHNYSSSSSSSTSNSNNNNNATNNSGETNMDIFYKVIVAGQMLWKDPKMKYMIGLNAVFGFTSAFLNSYVNGQVIPVALNDPDAKYIGILSAWVSTVAAGMSLLFGRIAPTTGKGSILCFGAVCFLGVVLPFLVYPDAHEFGLPTLLSVYSLHGIGRATFEGTLKATFADYFSYEKEGAFANIILQNGLSGAIGYVLTFSLLCDTPSRYCIEYDNGTLHDVLTFEIIVVVSAIAAVLGYLRASTIFRHEQHEQQQQERHDSVDNSYFLSSPPLSEHGDNNNDDVLLDQENENEQPHLSHDAELT